jgi:hypothetical protein
MPTAPRVYTSVSLPLIACVLVEDAQAMRREGFVDCGVNDDVGALLVVDE